MRRRGTTYLSTCGDELVRNRQSQTKANARLRPAHAFVASVLRITKHVRFPTVATAAQHEEVENCICSLAFHDDPYMRSELVGHRRGLRSVLSRPYFSLHCCEITKILIIALDVRHTTGEVPSDQLGLRCEDAVVLFYIRGALLQACSGAARGCKSLYATRAVTELAKYQQSTADRTRSKVGLWPDMDQFLTI